MKNDVVTLITITKEKDSDGFNVETEHETEIFAEVASVTRSEYYSAMRDGIKTALRVNISKDDFKLGTINGVKSTRIKVDSDIYKIGRTYVIDDDMEITCEVIE